MNCVILLMAYFQAYTNTYAEIDRLRRNVAPAADLVQPMPYCALQSLVDAGNPFGRRHYWRSDNLRALDDDTRTKLAQVPDRTSTG